MEGLQDMTQPELYTELKRLNPELAKGKSKTRRAELALLVQDAHIKADLNVTSFAAPVVSAVPAPKRKRPRKIKIVMSKSADWNGPQKAFFPNRPILPFSAKQKEDVLKLLDDVELVSNLTKHMRISSEKVSGLVALASGIDSAVVAKVLETFFNLKTTFTATKGQAA